jgi:alpha-ribazole phosphatase
MKLYLVRHPKPDVASGICYGASDVVCSAEVLESAAAQLLDELPPGLTIISSTLSRCEHFAQILCRREADYACKVDPRLAELDFGTWEMKSWAQIAPAELAAWTDAFATYRCGGTGESTAQFLRRVAARLHESLQSQEDQIWITHAGVIRAVQWLCTQSFESVTELASQPDPARSLYRLRAADWPRGEVAFGRVHRVLRQAQPSDWPPVWQPLPG